jgi:hypothetical protein
MVVSIGVALRKISVRTSQDASVTEVEIAGWIHEGWSQNYTYWLDKQPWLNNKEYSKPSKKFGDKRRNECAKALFEDLPQDEKDKDLVIARFLRHTIFPKTLKEKTQSDTPYDCLFD